MHPLKVDVHLQFDPTLSTWLWVNELEYYERDGDPNLLVRGQDGSWQRNVLYFSPAGPLPLWWVKTVADVAEMRGRELTERLADRLRGIARAGYVPPLSRHLSPAEIAVLRRASREDDALLSRLETLLCRLGVARDAVVTVRVEPEGGVVFEVEPADALVDRTHDELRTAVLETLLEVKQLELPVPEPTARPPRAPAHG